MVCVFDEGPIGINFACANTSAGEERATQTGDGAVVSRVVVLEATGPALEKGVMPGDAVVEVNMDMGEGEG